MATQVHHTGQKAERKSLLDRIKGMSFRNKVIGAAVLVFLVLLMVSIPGDTNVLFVHAERVATAQVAYDLAIEPVGPMMESVKLFIDEFGIADLANNAQYKGLNTSLTNYKRERVTTVSRFQAVLTFSVNVHSMLEGDKAIPELNTIEFQTLVASMDTPLGVARLALIELNAAIDEYNGYQSWISAKVAGILTGLPQGYPDPVPANSQLLKSLTPAVQ